MYNKIKNGDLQAAEQATVPSQMNAVIYGYGKIGKKTAGYLKGLGMQIFVVSAHADEQELLAQGYQKIREDQGWKNCGCYLQSSKLKWS